MLTNINRFRYFNNNEHQQSDTLVTLLAPGASSVAQLALCLSLILWRESLPRGGGGTKGAHSHYRRSWSNDRQLEGLAAADNALLFSARVFIFPSFSILPTVVMSETNINAVGHLTGVFRKLSDFCPACQSFDRTNHLKCRTFDRRPTRCETLIWGFLSMPYPNLTL